MTESAMATPETAPESNSEGAENKPASARRSGLRPFPKGISGNPGGRPKAEGHVRELARAHGPRAIRRLAELMGSDNPRVAVAACEALLDRGYGRPMSANGPGTGPLVNVTVGPRSSVTLTPREVYESLRGDLTADPVALLARMLPAPEVQS